ncbi:MAG: polyprenyl diphosphate synthase [Candidatus Moranbacteria bacterium]|nr:polyprenyl diphosphate synthase [Candidatus Moranbacteria bacterium]
MSELKNIPNHVAIIPDGNRRWAKKRGLQPWDGHEKAAQNLEHILRAAFDLGIRHFTFWGSSVDNLKKRPFAEKKALLDIYKRYFRKLIDSEDIHKNKAQINVIGKWDEQFPGSLKKVIRECVQKTKDYKNYYLNFLLAYNGDDEMVEAMRKIAKKCKSGARITAQAIKDNLMTKDLPPVDLLIRTGGEPHNSAGFMMWDVANSQLYFTEKMNPDFGPEDLKEAIRDYSSRGRRFGK